MRPLKVFLVILHILLGLFLLVALGAFRNPTTKKIKTAKAWWLGKVLNLMNIQVEVSGTPKSNNANGNGTIFVSNHVSWIDIPLIGSLNQINFLSKAEVKNWPLIGTLAEGVGTLFIQRGSGDTAKIIHQIADKINEGHSVLFFPEGTTTDGSSVKSFHRKLFRACEHTDCYFQPIAIHYEVDSEETNPVAFIGDDEFAEHLWRLLKFKSIKAHIEYLPARKFTPGALKQEVFDLECEMRRKIEVRSRKIETGNTEAIAATATT